MLRKTVVAQEEPAWTSRLLQEPHRVADKAERVRHMFNAIAPRYQRINSLFSFGRDAAWRRRAVRLADVRHDDDVLDIACGTGDFARAFAQRGPNSVVGCDFAGEMLAIAGRQPPDSIEWKKADALDLPFADASFSITSCAFGIRNFQDVDRGFREMRRVLRRGGRAVILEFSRPKRPVFRWLYELYANRFMPLAASIISGDRTGAYRYLPRSVVSFSGDQQVCEILQDAGFTRIVATPLTLGVVTVYVAYRDGPDGGCG